MKIVVGLGNPGDDYADTPHNLGFMVLDRLAREWSFRWHRSWRFRADTGRARAGEEPVVLAKPRTYMNRSGLAVGALVRYHRAGASDLIVVADDADLPLGRLRVRRGGGSGGHRGLASIIEAVGTEAFIRLRVGIGREASGRDLVDHVLTPFAAAERSAAEAVAARAAAAVCCIVEAGVDAAMNRFNGLPTDVSAGVPAVPDRK